MTLGSTTGGDVPVAGELTKKVDPIAVRYGPLGRTKIGPSGILKLIGTVHKGLSRWPQELKVPTLRRAHQRVTRRAAGPMGLGHDQGSSDYLLVTNTGDVAAATSTLSVAAISGRAYRLRKRAEP